MCLKPLDKMAPIIMFMILGGKYPFMSIVEKSVTTRSLGFSGSYFKSTVLNISIRTHPLAGLCSGISTDSMV